MSTLRVDNIKHNNATTDALVLSNDGSVAIGTCTAKLTSVGGAPLSHRNKVINGAMLISQRGTSFTNIGGATGQYTLDRFQLQTNDLDQAVATVSQDSSAPDGFSKSLKIQCTTAETSVENYEHARLIYDGEAFDFTDIGFGTSSAKKVTLSFWVKSNITGTWGINFWRGDANRSNLRTYTINSANTWEHKVITLVEDTTGGGVNADNGYGFRINWGLAAGTNYAQSHPLDTWHTFNTNYFYPYDARNTNFYSSTSNNFYLTGVQLEVGDTATSFEHRSISEELLRCQRYFKRMRGAVGGGGGYGSAGDGAVCTMANWTNTAAYGLLPLGVEMRYAPKLTGFSNLNYFSAGNTWAPGSTSQCYLAGSSYDRVELTLQGMSNMSQGNAGWLRIDNPSGYMDFDAEL